MNENAAPRAARRPFSVRAALAAALLATFYLAGGCAPRINDVSTDLANPPAFARAPTLPGNEGRDWTFPDAFREPIRRAYGDILEPVVVDLPPARAFAAAARAARSMPRWEITLVDAEAGRLEAVATTFLLRFKDDVAIRVSPQGEGSRIDVRSKSRLGQSDLGANAKRARAFLKRCLVEAASAASPE